MKSALFLHADTLMFNWCIDSVNETEIGRQLGTALQVNPTTIGNKEYSEKSVHPYKS